MDGSFDFKDIDHHIRILNVKLILKAEQEKALGAWDFLVLVEDATRTTEGFRQRT